jgi:5,10-methylenetetrahydromethanopterin reductase
VRSGLLLLPHESARDIAELAALAEAAGYDHFWLADERFFREVYATLTVAAARTERIRLGPCVTDPYSRHPALTAMAIATLDEIAGGRAELGIGAGISGFAELHVRREKPARAIREAIALIRRLLAGERVTERGEIVSLHDGALDFVPSRKDIPIYVASNGPLGQRTAGAAEAGRDSVSVELFARLNCCIADDGRAARDVLRPRVARTLGAGRLRFATLEAQGLALPPEARAQVAGAAYSAGFEPYRSIVPLITDRHVDALTLAGTVDEVAEHVVALHGAGIGRVTIHPFAPPGGTTEDTIERYGREVLPRVRRALGQGPVGRRAP